MTSLLSGDPSGAAQSVHKAVRRAGESGDEQVIRCYKVRSGTGPRVPEVPEVGGRSRKISEREREAITRG